RIAGKLGIGRILVPDGAGVGSAIGFLRAPVSYEVVRSLYQRLSRLDTAAVNALLEAMAVEAGAMVAAGAFGAAVTERRMAFMRYVGQGHEIPVPLPPGRLGADAAAALHAAYTAAYARFYDRPVPGSDIEIMSYAVLATTEAPAVASQPAAPAVPAPPPARWQAVRDTATGAVADWAVFPRAALAPGMAVNGPAILAEDATSTLVPAGWRAVAASGWVVLERAG
ncbi:MAG: hydantoinase/oxoprolinase family protein, partial [Acetobacteraceae bacterium]